MVFLEAPRVAWGVLGVQLGCPGGLYGALFGALGVAWGASWVLRGAFGRLGRPMGPSSFPMVAQGRHRVPFWLLMVCLWLHFGSILGAKIVKFSCYFLASFLDAFLEASDCIFNVALVLVGRSFLVFFPTL